MNSHRELYDLKDDFNNTYQYAIKDLCNKCNEIKNNLNNSYNIYISSNSYFYNINDCQTFLNKLKDKKNEINNYKRNNENIYSNIKNNHKENMNKLELEHKQRVEKLKEEFLEAGKKYSNDNLISENEIKNKKDTKKKLEDSINKINEDKETIINKYEEEERLKADLSFNNNLNEIDQKYTFKKEKLEYTKDELQLKQQYIDEIQKIKTYLKNPFCNNLIISTGLNQYLN
jgi:DNA repair exonuclease SbcCD ATPase subunit